MATTQEQPGTTAPPPDTNPEATPMPVDPGAGETQEEFDQKINQLRAEHAGKMDGLWEWVAGRLARLRLGHEMVMLDDVRKVMDEDRRIREGHSQMMFDGTPGGASGQPQPTAHGGQQGKSMNGHPLAGMEDMLNLGEINFHPPQVVQTPQQQAPPQPPPQPPAPQPQPQPPAPQPQPEVKKGLGKLAKAALGAGLIATGVGGTIGAPILWDAITGKDDPPPVTTPTDTDTDRWYELRLHPPGDDTK